MKIASNTTALGLLLKSEVGNINKSEIAGTEQVFLKDVATLRNYYKVQAFSRFKYQNPKVNSLFFIKKRMGNTLAFLNDFFYHLQFVILNQNKDILIGYSTPLLALLSNKKTVVFLHNNYKFPFYSLLRKKYQRANYVFCSQALKNEVLKKNRLSLPKTFVLHNSIDNNVFNCKQTQVTNAKKSNELQLLFCSAWSKEKGLNILLKAILLLPEKMRQRISLTISSSPRLWYSDNPELRKAYIKKSLKLIRKIKNVHLLNGVTHSTLSKLYFQSDYTVFPSIWNEPFGLVSLESIACGTKVICFSNPSTKEILDNNNSVLILEKSSAALKKCLVKLIKNHKNINANKKSLFSEKNSLMVDNTRINRFKKILDNLS